MLTRHIDAYMRVPQPLYRLANNGIVSFRLANNSKSFIEYRISVCYRISNKRKILFFVNTRPCLVGQDHFLVGNGNQRSDATHARAY